GRCDQADGCSAQIHVQDRRQWHLAPAEHLRPDCWLFLMVSAMGCELRVARCALGAESVVVGGATPISTRASMGESLEASSHETVGGGVLRPNAQRATRNAPTNGGGRHVN